VLPLPLNDEDDRLETIHNRNHDQRENWQGTSLACNDIDKVTKVDTGSRKDNSSHQVQEHNESHGEETESAQFLKKEQFEQVVNGRVDPATPLGEQNTPGFGGSSVRKSIRDELVAHVGEVLGHKGGKVTIFSKRQQVLLMQSIDIAIRVLINDLAGNDKRTALVRGAQTIHAETKEISLALLPMGVK